MTKKHAKPEAAPKDPKPTPNERAPSGIGARLDVPIIIDPKNMSLGGFADGLDEHAKVMANPLVIEAIAEGRGASELPQTCTTCGTVVASGATCVVDGTVAP